MAAPSRTGVAVAQHDALGPTEGQLVPRSPVQLAHGRLRACRFDVRAGLHGRGDLIEPMNPGAVRIVIM